MGMHAMTMLATLLITHCTANQPMADNHAIDTITDFASEVDGYVRMLYSHLHRDTANDQSHTLIDTITADHALLMPCYDQDGADMLTKMVIENDGTSITVIPGEYTDNLTRLISHMKEMAGNVQCTDSPFHPMRHRLTSARTIRLLVPRAMQAPAPSNGMTIPCTSTEYASIAQTFASAAWHARKCYLAVMIASHRIKKDVLHEVLHEHCSHLGQPASLHALLYETYRTPHVRVYVCRECVVRNRSVRAFVGMVVVVMACFMVLTGIAAYLLTCRS